MSVEEGSGVHGDQRPGGRPLIGSVLVVIAVVHVLATPVFFGEAFASIIEGGVIGTVEADPALVDLRSAGFWYLMAGIVLLAVGLDVAWIERRCEAPPVHVGWMLLLMACVGTVLIPVSPFWLFFVAAGLVVRSRRSFMDVR